jgi:hypothetical protein
MKKKATYSSKTSVEFNSLHDIISKKLELFNKASDLLIE